MLSPEQQTGLTAFLAGQNFFLTGPGGTGKTELIKQMVAAAKTAGRNYQVCAMTGCAAILLNCGAKTVHSWAGIGLANAPVSEIVTKVLADKKKVKRWRETDVLIIDEVSMMSQKIFELLDELGKRARKNLDAPFGGLQVIVSGDFYQLPPVSRPGDDLLSAAFCFESPRWASAFPLTIALTTIFRQNDLDYCTILNQIRVGKLYKSSLALLTPHIGKVNTDPLFKPTKLFPTRKEVEIINASEYANLAGPEYIYNLSRIKPEKVLQQTLTGMSFHTIPDTVKEFEYQFLSNNLLVEPVLRLKIGTQVMCVCNLTEQVVNGSQGIVISFQGDQHIPVVRFKNGVVMAMDYHSWLSDNVPGIGVAHIPLIFAWAVTIHKSQGASLDVAEIDAGSNIFECGQTYVALSRVKSLEGLYLTAFDPSKIRVNQKVQEFYARLQK